MNTKTLRFSFLIAVLLMAMVCAADPSESSSSAAPSASGQKCPPIACTQPSGKPKCPSACPDNCQFENDKCCPNKQVGVCASSASSGASGSSSPTATSAAASSSNSGAASASASSPVASSGGSGASSSPSASGGSASSPSPSTSAGVLTRNSYQAYLFSMVIGVLCIVFLY